MSRFASEQVRAVRWKRIEVMMAEVCRGHHVTPDEILSKKRTAIVTAARHDLMTRAWLTGIPMVEVGRLLDRDHSSVRHGIIKHLGLDEFRRVMGGRLAHVADAERVQRELSRDPIEAQMVIGC